MRSKILQYISAWLPVILWCALIFNFSSGTVPVASNDYWKDFAVKKTGHVLLFGALALFLYRAFRISGVNKFHAAVAATILATFYGATDEFHQMYTLGREPRVRDVIIDGIGAGMVSGVLYYLPGRLPESLKGMVKSLDIL